MEIGSVLSARNVNTHDVPTMMHFIADSMSSSRVITVASLRRPQIATPTTYATHPKQVEMSNVGRTALSRTLAFFARS